MNLTEVFVFGFERDNITVDINEEYQDVSKDRVFEKKNIKGRVSTKELTYDRKQDLFKVQNILQKRWILMLLFQQMQMR